MSAEWSWFTGYKASGDTQTLKALGEEFGIKVKIVDLISLDAADGCEKVSSSQVSSRVKIYLSMIPRLQVRDALADGNIKAVNALLGRNYTLLLNTSDTKQPPKQLSFPRSCFLNQPPKNGTYTVQLGSTQGPAEVTEHGFQCPVSNFLHSSTPLRVTFL